jgi:tetratricopeptide (TPR) repeat protein
MCRTLLAAAGSNFRRLTTEEERRVPLAWLKYWESRVAFAERAPRRAESILRKLLATDVPDERLALWARADLGEALEQQDRLDEVEAELTAALAIAERTGIDSWNLPVWQANLANLYWTLQRNRAAVEGFRRMIGTAEEQGNERMLAHGRLSLAGCLRMIGGEEEAFRIALDALHLARTRLATDRGLQVRVAETFIGFEAGDLGLADTLIAEADALLRSGPPRLRHDFFVRALVFISEQGRMGLGGRVAAGLANDGEGADYPEAMSAIAGLRQAEGRLDDAVALYRRVLAMVEPGATDARYTEAAAQTNIAMLEQELGHLDAALEAAEEARAKWASIGHDVLEGLAEVFAGDALRRAGRWDEAQQRLEGAGQALADAVPEHQATWCAALGELRRAHGDLPAAATAFERARQVAASVRGHRAELKNLARLVDVHAAASRWGDADRDARRLAELTTLLETMERYAPSDQRREADEQNARGIDHFTRAGNDRTRSTAQARDFFRSAARNAPESPWPALNLAYACLELGEWDDAQKAVGAVVAFGSPWSYVGELLADARPAAA